MGIATGMQPFAPLLLPEVSEQLMSGISTPAKTDGRFSSRQSVDSGEDLRWRSRGRIRPGLPELVMQIGGIGDDPTDDGRCQHATEAVMQRIPGQLHRMQMVWPEEHPLDDTCHTQALVNSPKHIHRSRHSHPEKDLNFIFRNVLLVKGMAKDPHITRQIHEATGVPLRRLHVRRDDGEEVGSRRS
jgi:hypothetical protein